MYSSGLLFAAALILNQNPFFEIGSSNRSLKKIQTDFFDTLEESGNMKGPTQQKLSLNQDSSPGPISVNGEVLP